MDEAPDNVVFFNDYTAENYAASARAAAEPEINTKVQMPGETALLASAYIINPNNVKLDGPDQYIQEHDFYENDEVLEALERQKELMLEGMYKDPAKILLLIRQLSMMFSSYPEWPPAMKPKDGTIESAKQETAKMLSKLKDIYVDIEFMTKFKREDNLQTQGPLSRTPSKAFLEKPYATLMTDLMRGMVSQLVANTKMGGFGEKTEQGKSSSSAGPNNGLVASRLLMELPQPIVHELRVLLSTLKSDISPLIPMLLTNQEELQFILNIVRDREEEIAREIHERMQGERNRKKKEKREKYLRSAQAYKSLTQGKVDPKLYDNQWNAQWSRQKIESKDENRHSQQKEVEPAEQNREFLGKRPAADWNATSTSTSGWGTSAVSQRSSSPQLVHQEMKKDEENESSEPQTAQEKSPLEFQLSILSLCQKASSLIPEANGLSTIVEENNSGLGEGWDLPDNYSSAQVNEPIPEISQEKKEPIDTYEVSNLEIRARTIENGISETSPLDAAQSPEVPETQTQSVHQAETTLEKCGASSQQIISDQKTQNTETEPEKQQLVGQTDVFDEKTKPNSDNSPLSPEIPVAVEHGSEDLSPIAPNLGADTLQAEHQTETAVLEHHSNPADNETPTS